VTLKKILPFSFVLLTISAFLCTNPQNPFSNPDNAKIYMVLKDSKNQVGANISVTDTVGNKYKDRL
jgi:hypothetical protein